MASHTPNGRTITDLILQVFQINGALLAAGDKLVEDLGLTSARWQVVGAIALEGRPLTVAQIGRRMGISRQAVQRVANDLVAEGLVVFQENPDHKRSKLVALSERGEAAYAKADSRQADWANELARGIKREDLAAASRVLQVIYQRLESHELHSLDGSDQRVRP